MSSDPTVAKPIDWRASAQEAYELAAANEAAGDVVSRFFAPLYERMGDEGVRRVVEEFRGSTS